MYIGTIGMRCGDMRRRCSNHREKSVDRTGGSCESRTDGATSPRQLLRLRLSQEPLSLGGQMAWLESHQELADHPKTKRAARSLGIGIPQMVGHLHLLWWWAMDYAQDGDLSEFDNEDIAEAARWEGDVASFVAAMTECGTGSGEGFLTRQCEINDWDDFGGKYIKRREQARDRQRKKRERDGDIDERHDDVTRDNSVSHTPTGQDRTEEEKTEEEHAPNGSAPATSQPELPEITDISSVEQFVVSCVQAVRGAATIPDHEIVQHFRHNLDIRGSPVSEMTIRREFTKFRDFHQPKRANQPKNGRWRGWKNAMTNWVGRIPDEPEPEIDRLTALYGPEYGVDE